MYVSPLRSVLSDSYAKLYRSGSLWVDEFQMIELAWQHGDSEFCELLCRTRTGAGGEVVHVVTSNDDKITHILVKFDNQDVGAKAKQSSQYRHQYTDAVPLIKHEAVFQAKGRRLPVYNSH